MAVAFASSTNLAYASHTNSVVTKPTGVAEGDLMLCWIIVAAATSPTPTPPTGWELVPGPTWPTTVTLGGFTVKGRVYYKVAGGSEPTSYTWTHTVASSAAAMVRITGAGATPSFVAAITSKTFPEGGATMTYPSVTTTAAESLIAIFAHDWGDTANNLTPPTGTTPTFTERLDATLDYCATGTLVSAGAMGTKTMTGNSTGSDPWATVTIAVEPPAGGTPQNIACATGGVATAGLAVTAPTKLPLAVTSGVGVSALALSAATRIVPGATAGVASAVVKVNAPTRIAPAVAAGVATAALVVSRPQPVAPGAATGLGAALLALTAATALPLSPVAGLSGASLALSAPARLVLAPTAGVSTAALALEIAASGVNLPLQPSTGVGTAVLGLSAAAKLALSATGVGVGSLALTARPLLALTAAGEGTAAAALNAPSLLTLLTAGVGSAAAALSAATRLPLAPAAGASTAALVITTPGSAAIIPSATGGQGAAALALTARSVLGVLLAPGVGSAAAALRAVPQIAPRSEGVATAVLSLKVTPRLTLISAGVGQPALVVSTKVFLALMASGEGQAALALAVLAVVGIGTATISATPVGAGELVVVEPDGVAGATLLGEASISAARRGSATVAGRRGSATLVVKP